MESESSEKYGVLRLKLNTETENPNAPFSHLETWNQKSAVAPDEIALTVLGIFIGVASVIWLLAIGEGISQEAQRQIEDLGTENIIVRSIQPPDESGGNFREIKAFGVKHSEAQMIERTVSTVKRVLPIREIPQKFAYTGNPNVKPIDGRLVGCTPDYADVTLLVTNRGHFLTWRECDSKLSVCVIAAHAQKLFPSEDPLNKQIYLPEKKEFYKIVGVLEHRQCDCRHWRFVGSVRIFRWTCTSPSLCDCAWAMTEQKRTAGRIFHQKS